MRQERCVIPQKRYMQSAIDFAERAMASGEVPVGAVIVYKNEIIAHGENRRETEKSAVCHAEIEAIHRACKALGDWRLSECELYVTLEPCPMCMGAVLSARIKRVVFGAEDVRTGSCGSALDLRGLEFYRYPDIFPGFMEEKCIELMKEFFKGRR